MLRVRPTNFDNPMVLMLWSSVHSIGSQMHNGRADLLFPTTHATRSVLREWGAAPRTALVIFRLARCSLSKDCNQGNVGVRVLERPDLGAVALVANQERKSLLRLRARTVGKSNRTTAIPIRTHIASVTRRPVRVSWPASMQQSTRLKAHAVLLAWALMPYIRAVPRTSPFIIPAIAAQRDRPPSGDAWLHEVKFDGYRCQLHKGGKDVIIFSKNGREFTSRFPGIREALLSLSCKSAIIDAESSPAGKTARPTSEHFTPATTARRTSAFGASISWSSMERSATLPLIARKQRLESCSGATIIPMSATLRPSRTPSSCLPSVAFEA